MGILQGNSSPNDSDNDVENVHHNEANVSSSNGNCLSDMDIQEDLFESNGTKKKQ